MIENVPPYKVEPMQWSDVTEVMAIERTAFTLPWSDYTYRHELLENHHSHYFVARRLNGASLMRASWLTRLFSHERKAPIVGYGGFWLVIDEAHISTIASGEAWRGHGIGAALVAVVLRLAAEAGYEHVVTNWRMTNLSASRFWPARGFQPIYHRLHRTIGIN